MGGNPTREPLDCLEQPEDVFVGGWSVCMGLYV